VFAQLRDVLAAENSAVVTEEDDYRWTLTPKRSELNQAVGRFRQEDRRQARAEIISHAAIVQVQDRFVNLCIANAIS